MRAVHKDVGHVGYIISIEFAAFGDNRVRVGSSLIIP